MRYGVMTLPDYVCVEGSDGLMKVLDQFLDEYRQGKALDTPRYVLYQLGSQRSLIRVDIDQLPFRFWYCDLLGRPATITVKRTIAAFLLDKCGEKERLAKELSDG